MSTALITGASQGFGRALTEGLARLGWTVIAAGRDSTRLEAIGRTRPGVVVTERGDLRDAEHRLALADRARACGLDLIVHNASALGPSPLPTITGLGSDDLREILEVNVVAPLALTQLLLPTLRLSDAPTIVSLSSDAAVEGYPGWGGYGSSKAALDQLIRVLASEQPAMSVYSFDPGDMRTDMHQRAFPGEDISDRPEPSSVVPAFLELLRTRPPNGRYLASDLTDRAALSVGSSA